VTVFLEAARYVFESRLDTPDAGWHSHSGMCEAIQMCSTKASAMVDATVLLKETYELDSPWAYHMYWAGKNQFSVGNSKEWRKQVIRNFHTRVYCLLLLHEMEITS
jgi:hypothetical protein